MLQFAVYFDIKPSYLMSVSAKLLLSHFVKFHQLQNFQKLQLFNTYDSTTNAPCLHVALCRQRIHSNLWNKQVKTI